VPVDSKKLAYGVGDDILPEGIPVQEDCRVTFEPYAMEAFVYFQPGNGKVKIKEPTDLSFKAVKKISDAIEIGKGSLLYCGGQVLKSSADNEK